MGFQVVHAEEEASIRPQLQLLHGVINADEVTYVSSFRVAEVLCRGVCRPGADCRQFQGLLAVAAAAAAAATASSRHFAVTYGHGTAAVVVGHCQLHERWPRENRLDWRHTEAGFLDSQRAGTALEAPATARCGL